MCDKQNDANSASSIIDPNLTVKADYKNVPSPPQTIYESVIALDQNVTSLHSCLTPTDANNTSRRSSSLTPSEMKLFSFPWRRRSTSCNIQPKWAFRRFRYKCNNLHYQSNFCFEKGNPQLINLNFRYY